MIFYYQIKNTPNDFKLFQRLLKPQGASLSKLICTENNIFENTLHPGFHETSNDLDAAIQAEVEARVVLPHCLCRTDLAPESHCSWIVLYAALLCCAASQRCIGHRLIAEACFEAHSLCLRQPSCMNRSRPEPPQRKPVEPPHFGDPGVLCGKLCAQYAAVFCDLALHLLPHQLRPLAVQITLGAC